MWQMAASCIPPAPQQSPWGVRGSIHGALIHVWRPEIASGCDLSCLLICQGIFSFQKANRQVISGMTKSWGENTIKSQAQQQQKVKVKVIQLCLTLCNPMNDMVHGILQVRILEWVAFPFSRGSFQPRIEPRSPALQVDSLPAEPQGKPKNTGVGSLSLLQWIFPTQELNWGILHCRWILYQLNYQGSILKTRDITLPTKVHLFKLWFLQQSCMAVRLDYKENRVPENQCF